MERRAVFILNLATVHGSGGTPRLKRRTKMISISGFLHNAELYDLIRRWMMDQPKASDVLRLQYLIHFNNVFAARYLHLFSCRLFRALYGMAPRFRRARIKADLKDRIVVNPPYTNGRIAEMLAQYDARPGQYYRETPFHGTLFFIPDENGRYVGSCRIKRIRRLAEKSARRITDRIFETIKAHAERLADERAVRLGIARQFLITPTQDMEAEFFKAEQRVLDDLRSHQPMADLEGLVINDMTGLKVILEPDSHDHLKAIMELFPDCRIEEEEQHRGRYEATNLIVAFKPPKREILSRPLTGSMIKILESGGLPAHKVQEEFERFVMAAEDQIRLEIIVSTYQEMLESEIGRCMHEDRIIRQRQSQAYQSQIATNIEFLMEYLFALPVSGRKGTPVLPVKLWNRYLPDYFEEVRKQLFGIPSPELDNGFFPAESVPPGHCA
jgi:hypothetical protein